MWLLVGHEVPDHCLLKFSNCCHGGTVKPPRRPLDLISIPSYFSDFLLSAMNSHGLRRFRSSIPFLWGNIPQSACDITSPDACSGIWYILGAIILEAIIWHLQCNRYMGECWFCSQNFSEYGATYSIHLIRFCCKILGSIRRNRCDFIWKVLYTVGFWCGLHVQLVGLYAFHDAWSLT